MVSCMGGLVQCGSWRSLREVVYAMETVKVWNWMYFTAHGADYKRWCSM